MKSYRILYSSVGLILLAILLSEFSETVSNKRRYVGNFQKVLWEKKEKTYKYFKQIESIPQEKTLKTIERANNDRIYLFKYRNDSLQFWSSNAISVFDIYPDTLFNKRITQIFNSFYYVVEQDIDSVKYIGLILIKSRYHSVNEYLQSGFDPSYKLPKNARLSFNSEEGNAVVDADKQFLFSIIVDSTNKTEGVRSVIATLFLFLGLILAGIYSYLLLAEIKDAVTRSIWVIIFLSSIWIIRIIQLYFSIHIGNFSLFEPYIFADSLLVPSLGDLLVNSLIVFLSAILLIRLLDWNLLISGQSGYWKVFRPLSLNVLVLCYFLYAHYFSHSLIFNSSISLRVNEINQLTIYSVLSFIVHGLNFLSAFIILVKAVRYIVELDTWDFIIPVLFLTTSFIFTGLYLLGYPIEIVSVLFFGVMIGIVFLLLLREIEINSYTILMLLILLFSLYSLIFFVSQSHDKESIMRSTLAISLDSEHDPVAEFLFEELSSRIEQDTAINARLNSSLIDINEMYDYLKKNYFSGFWNKYDMQITLCGPIDSVLIEYPDFMWFHCYGFFDEIIDEVGFTLPETRFYYLDLNIGRISYLGRFVFEQEMNPFEITLFIELDSRLTKNLLGYPELFLDEKFHQERLVEKYSYAKYYKGKLVAQSGDFSYTLSPELFGDIEIGNHSVNFDDYNHLIYCSEPDNLIVISQARMKFIDYLITFSYLFLFYYILLFVAIGVRRILRSEVQFLGNFRSKIQVSILSILLVSLILIAVSTIWLSVRSYRQNQDRTLHEKIQSVLIELTHKLAFEDELTPDWSADKYDNLDQLLTKFSDVFYSDINLYDTEGNLLATSRSEVFQLGMQGRKMNPEAFFRLNQEKRAQFIHRERISKLSYLSAYVPFENAEGKLLAYLNLPYFTKQKDLQSSIVALVVTIINIYVILILITVILTVLISEQITRPLELLQLRFRDLKLGSPYEKIRYKRNDEIGNLVAEYNKMVSELEHSVELLARSERESAWREMAKQIAHEIKNPLTPMRLGLQQLQRAYRDEQQDFDKQFDRLAESLIEQIDNLSTIATEFSNFAKMPVADIREINLIDEIKKATELFKGHTNYSVSFKAEIDNAPIKADSTQISRLFINLIKNGIQSIPENRKGEINIIAIENSNAYEIRISDNGNGIPDHVRSKLFMPNFTTKSSGMGLGLAIVKNILDPLGAHISFTTKLNEGTTFLITFPKNEY